MPALILVPLYVSSFLSSPPPPPPSICIKFALSAESLLVQKLLLAELHTKIKIQVRQSDIGQRGFYRTQKRKTAHKEFLNQTAPEIIAETFTKLLLCYKLRLLTFIDLTSRDNIRSDISGRP